MERVTRIRWCSLGLFIALAAFAGALPAFAGALEDEQVYPESRFGQPPARPDIGVSRGLAGREADYWDRDQQKRGEPDGAERADQRVGNRTLASAPDAIKSTMPGSLPDAKSAIRQKGVQEIALIAGDLGFFPKTVFVTRDVPVRLFVTGSSKNTLCIMMDDFHIRKQIRSQKIEEITFIPEEPGKYRFYCPVNGMEGTMVVKELVTASPASQSRMQ